MDIQIQPYTEEWTPAVKAFNDRVVAGGLEEELRFFESHVPEYRKAEGSPIFQEYFLAVEDQSVRGTYCLTHEPWSLLGSVRSVGHYRLPISEVIANKAYRGLSARLLEDALRRLPLLFSIGMGGLDRPMPQRLKASGWSQVLVPFFFKVHKPVTFLRNITHLRKTKARMVALDAAAFSGAGWLGIKVLQGLRGLSSVGEGAASAEIVPRFSEWADELWERCRTRYALTAVRDSNMLNLRYRPENPKFIRLKVSNAGGILGWALLVDTAMRDNRYFGDLRVGSLADCLALPEDAPAVIASATRVLQTRGVDLIVSNQSHTAWCKALRRAGFLEGPSNYGFAASPQFSELLHPWDVHKTEFHLNRGDGAGPVRL